MLKLYNSRTGQVENFKPINGDEVGMYACGPTVYNYAHIGNLRTYFFEDILVRVLKYNGLKVNHVMNITDVGHLTDDADLGEDKMEKGAKREGKTAWQIADFYTDEFLSNLDDLNIWRPNIICKATAHIPEQIKLVSELIDKGLTYETNDGIYFDTTKINDYGEIIHLKDQQLKAGARIEMGEKRNPHDFALWKWSKNKRQMEWLAFNRIGFPGWHIECSAMAMKYLGEQFDIHCGGIDLLTVHHINEIAQSEAVTNKKPWVNFWLHGQFLDIESNTGEEKMSKSSGNFITLKTLKEKNISPLAYRFFLLQAHYRKQLAFSWEALTAAENGLKNLKNQVNQIDPKTQADHHLEAEFIDAINNDLNTAEALSVLWTGLKEKKISKQTVIEFDKVFGLNLHEPEEKIIISTEVEVLLEKRADARNNKKWVDSDQLRKEINLLGFEVKDTPEGQKVKKI